jgi:hypothetical protein
MAASAARTFGEVVVALEGKIAHGRIGRVASATAAMRYGLVSGEKP